MHIGYWLFISTYKAHINALFCIHYYITYNTLFYILNPTQSLTTLLVINAQ